MDILFSRYSRKNKKTKKVSDISSLFQRHLTMSLKKRQNMTDSVVFMFFLNIKNTRFPFSEFVLFHTIIIMYKDKLDKFRIYLYGLKKHKW